MPWGVAIFGGVLVFAGFGEAPRFDTSDKWGIVVGAVFVLAGLIAEARR